MVGDPIHYGKSDAARGREGDLLLFKIRRTTYLKVVSAGERFWEVRERLGQCLGVALGKETCKVTLGADSAWCAFPLLKMRWSNARKSGAESPAQAGGLPHEKAKLL
jgi:hypothetical protein